mmetsp:Transcript_8779/g.27527  ORF Transcript_8779/g.27527 Transcript_8779/m.27527 type:complete len:216 (-) Transcript_8779:407-1054(-)
MLQGERVRRQRRQDDLAVSPQVARRVGECRAVAPDGPQRELPTEPGRVQRDAKGLAVALWWSRPLVFSLWWSARRCLLPHEEGLHLVGQVLPVGLHGVVALPLQSQRAFDPVAQLADEHHLWAHSLPGPLVDREVLAEWPPLAGGAELPCVGLHCFALARHDLQPVGELLHADGPSGIHAHLEHGEGVVQPDRGAEAELRGRDGVPELGEGDDGL